MGFDPRGLAGLLGYHAGRDKAKPALTIFRIDGVGRMGDDSDEIDALQ
jgi:hypothetical protein